MTGTITEFADKFKTERSEVAGFVNFLVSKNIAKKIGEQKSPTGKGKAAGIYEIPDSFNIDLVKIINTVGE